MMEMLPSGLPERVHDDEDLARFLASSSHFNSKMVKPSAFLPRRKDNTTSVFRHGSEPCDRLWQIGDVELARVRRIYGVAFIKARQVRAASLDVAGKEPPPRHANIIGWPTAGDDPEMKKAQQIERAAMIAQHAELARREPT